MRKQIPAAVAAFGLALGSVALFPGTAIADSTPDCTDESVQARVEIGDTGDPWSLDADGNGFGCESFEANGTVSMTSLIASDVNIEAWAQKHKGVIKSWVKVDVDKCEGFKGLSYEGATNMADVRDINLDALVELEDGAKILEYVLESGITWDQLTGLLDDFCKGEVTTPPVQTEEPDEPVQQTDEPEATDEESSAPLPEPESDDPEPTDTAEGPTTAAPSSTPVATNDDPATTDGSLAETGGMSPLLPVGIATAMVGVGGSLFALRRKGIL